jgi:hypothetical protein
MTKRNVLDIAASLPMRQPCAPGREGGEFQPSLFFGLYLPKIEAARNTGFYVD